MSVCRRKKKRRPTISLSQYSLRGATISRPPEDNRISAFNKFNAESKLLENIPKVEFQV